jgi:hypothetical protein
MAEDLVYIFLRVIVTNYSALEEWFQIETSFLSYDSRKYLWFY